jgi:hypothetical protein
MSRSKQLQKQIDDAIKAMAEVVPTHAGSDVRAARLHCEIFVAASQLAEISTRRVVHLTWALLAVTIGLLAVEVRDVFFPQAPHTEPDRTQQQSNAKVVIPSVTK